MQRSWPYQQKGRAAECSVIRVHSEFFGILAGGLLRGPQQVPNQAVAVLPLVPGAYQSLWLTQPSLPLMQLRLSLGFLYASCTQPGQHGGLVSKA